MLYASYRRRNQLVDLVDDCYIMFILSSRVARYQLAATRLKAPQQAGISTAAQGNMVWTLTEAALEAYNSDDVWIPATILWVDIVPVHLEQLRIVCGSESLLNPVFRQEPRPHRALHDQRASSPSLSGRFNSSMGCSAYCSRAQRPPSDGQLKISSGEFPHCAQRRHWNFFGRLV